MNSIPNDLFFEIFSRLPSKSIARFSCVSKLWESMLHGPYFTELFLTRSSARPRLLFAFRRRHDSKEWIFLSLPQPHNPYENLSSPVVAADFHMTFPMLGRICGYASGLILSIKDQEHVICNPNTGQYLILPKVRKPKFSKSLLGFDPIDKQFKVLYIKKPSGPFVFEGDCRILTLGTGKVSWRKVQCPLTDFTSSDGICINGVLYCLATKVDETYKIFCFDVRSEKFKIIDMETFNARPEGLVNYKGKLAVIQWKRAIAGTGKRTFELHTCVLDDVEKHEWSKYVYTFPDNNEYHTIVSVLGVTTTGEIVLSTTTCYTFSPPFCVFYFYPERKSLQQVQILGFDEWSGRPFAVFVDHVEDLNVNDAKLLKSSIYIPFVKKQNTVDEGKGRRLHEV